MLRDTVVLMSLNMGVSSQIENADLWKFYFGECEIFRLEYT